MSPTAATVMRIRKRSGSAGTGSGTAARSLTGADSVSISSAGSMTGGAGGVEAQAASKSSGRMQAFLVTEADSQDVNAGLA